MNTEEHERQEREKFFRDLAAPFKMTASERRKAKEELAEAMGQRPQVIGERISWLLNGSYGYGSFQASKAMVENWMLGGRVNVVVVLMHWIGSLEWKATPQAVRDLWRNMTSTQKIELSQHIVKAIASDI